MGLLRQDIRAHLRRDSHDAGAERAPLRYVGRRLERLLKLVAYKIHFTALEAAFMQLEADAFEVGVLDQRWQDLVLLARHLNPLDASLSAVVRFLDYPFRPAEDLLVLLLYDSLHLLLISFAGTRVLIYDKNVELLIELGLVSYFIVSASLGLLGGRRARHHICKIHTRLLSLRPCQMPARLGIISRITARRRRRSVRSLKQVVTYLCILGKELLLQAHFGCLLILQSLVELAETQLVRVE